MSQLCATLSVRPAVEYGWIAPERISCGTRILHSSCVCVLGTSWGSYPFFSISHSRVVRAVKALLFRRPAGSASASACLLPTDDEDEARETIKSRLFQASIDQLAGFRELRKSGAMEGKRTRGKRRWVENRLALAVAVWPTHTSGFRPEEEEEDDACVHSPGLSFHAALEH